MYKVIDMISLRELEKTLLAEHIGNGNVVADFTVGNGNDTLWLAKRVGEHGTVYGFDIQKQAVNNTIKLLEDNGVSDRCRIICDSHHNMLNYIDQKLDAGVFNLGFLPGGDKGITTLRETTIPAIKTAISLINPGGCLLIAIYPGHEEGRLEGELVCEMLSSYEQKHLSAYRFNVLNASTSPYFIFIEVSPRYNGGVQQ